MDEILESVIERTKAVKKRLLHVQAHAGDFPPTLDFYRDVEPVAFIYCGDVDKDLALRGIRSGLTGFDADVVYLTMDSVGCYNLTEEQMRRVKPGEFQERWEAGDREGLHEEFLFYRAVRGVGITDRVGVPYYVRQGTHPRWSEERDGSDVPLGGWVTELIDKLAREATPIEEDPLYQEHVAPFAVALSDDEKRHHQDMGMLNALFILGYGGGIYARRNDRLRLDIIEYSFERNGMKCEIRDV